MPAPFAHPGLSIGNRHRPSSIFAVAALLAWLFMFGTPAPPTSAQTTPDPQLIVFLHGGDMEVRTASTVAPQVRLLDGEGGVLANVTAQRKSGEGWVATMTASNALPGEPAVMVRPGHRVEATVDGRTVLVDVPEMTAEADTENDTVSGAAPATQGVILLLGWQTELFGEGPGIDPQVGLVDSNGRYRFELAGTFDLRPGTFGNVAMANADGHYLVTPFAPPLVMIDHQQPAATVRAGGGLDVQLITLGPSGAERSRSRQVVEYGSGLYGVFLSRGGSTQDPFVPRAGETLQLELGGQVAVSEPIPWVAATVDPGASIVRGLTPPGARTVVLAALADDNRRARATVVGAEDGTFEVDYSELGRELDNEATVQSWPGGAVLHTIRGRAPNIQVELWGNRLLGATTGWGELRIEHLPADGRPSSTGIVDADPGGSFTAELYYRGDQATFGAGDLLRFVPEYGETLELTVPVLTAAPDTDRLRLSGEAPPNADLIALVYGREPDIFGREQFDDRYVEVRGTADEDGKYTLTCNEADEDCRMRFGWVATRQGVGLYLMEWLDAPTNILAVSLGNAIGRLTAGEAVELALFDPDGSERAVLESVGRPGPGGQLPGWEIPLVDLWPDGIPVGAMLRVRTGDTVRQDVVPELTWTANTRANTVSGTGPPLQPMLVLAIAPPGDNRGARAVNAAIGANGRWSVRLPFDFQSGDDLYIYVLGEGGNILQWYEGAVLGNDPSPTPPPTATPLPDATPTPTATPPGRVLWLPWGEG
jgi:hypothetical protein